MAITLAPKQQRYLRKLAHHKKPIVTVGNAGLTEAVLAEAEICIDRHELMKIRVNAPNQSSRKAMTQKICQALDAALVLSIGHIIAIYRPATPAQIQLPKP